MTKLQIEYAKHKEVARSNKVNERIKQGTLEETKRSNLVGERISQGTLDEAIRSHGATERLQHAQNLETGRSNRAREGLESSKQAETKRSNLARETETNRSNLAAETERHRSATASEKQRALELAARSAELAERVRHDMAMETKNYAPTVAVGPTTTTVNNPSVNPSKLPANPQTSGKSSDSSVNNQSVIGKENFGRTAADLIHEANTASKNGSSSGFGNRGKGFGGTFGKH